MPEHAAVERRTSAIVGWLLPPWAEDVPATEGISSCRSCGAPVLWVISRASKKRSPLNPDGSSHFSTCPQADRWRTPRGTKA